MSEIRGNRDQIAEEFDTKVVAIREHYDTELARLSDEVMNEAQVSADPGGESAGAGSGGQRSRWRRPRQLSSPRAKRSKQ